MGTVITFVSLGFAILLAGCANMDSVHREFNVSKGEGALIDIKQRAIFVNPSKVMVDGKEQNRTIVCAEPSPDALSAFAFELAAKSDAAKLPMQLAASSQEGAAFVGLRTQSIQLLRDSLYRLCEGYMSGALSAAQYQLEARRYQKYMVALLAIEQLTSTVRAPNVTLTSQGSAEAARSLSEIQKELNTTNSTIDELTQKKAAGNLSESESAAIDNQLIASKANKAALEQGIQNTRSVLTSGSTSAAVSQVGVSTQSTATQLATVTSAVSDIVKTVISDNDYGHLCFIALSEHSGTLSESKKALLSDCQAYFHAFSVYNDKIIERYASDPLQQPFDLLTPTPSATQRNSIAQVVPPLQNPALLSMQRKLNLEVVEVPLDRKKTAGKCTSPKCKQSAGGK